MRKLTSLLLPLLGLSVIVAIVVATFAMSVNPDMSLDIRRRASGEQLAVTLANSSTKIQPNQAMTVDLLVNNQGRFVSGFQFSGTITGVNQDLTGLVVSQVNGLNPVFSEVKKVGNDLQFKLVELATLGGSAFTTHDQNQKLATFNLYPLRTGEVKLSFDQAKSGAMEFEKEFLTVNVAEKSYSVEVTSNVGGGGGNAPADAGIHRSCNEYCADSRECSTQYSCWYNRCRNPKNLTEEKCTDPVVVKPVVQQPTTQSTPKGGTAASPSPSPKTTVATVIISTASTSAQTATRSGIGSFGLGTAQTASPSPRVSPTASPTVRNLGPASPSPSPTVAPKPAQNQSSLGFLIGAAIVTGILAFVAIIFFLKNRNSGYQG